MLNDIQWIFIDVGDTLMDESAPHRKRMEDVARYLTEQGHPVTYEQLAEATIEKSKSYIRWPFGAVLEEIGIDVPPEILYFDKEMERPFEGGAEVLRQLKDRGYKIAILANQPLGTRERMERYGFLPYLDEVFGSAEAGMEKPDLAFFRYALERTGADPARSVMIGDRLDNDVGPAKACGIKGIHILQGTGGHQLPVSPEYQPEATVKDLWGLLEVLP